MIRNFIFHRVVPVVEDHSLQVGVELFKKCVEYICTHYEVICIEDIVQFDNLKPCKKPYACITFDDGYIDNIEYAAPILDKYNCKASFYVVTKSVDEGTPIWSYMLRCLFLKTHITHIKLDLDFIPADLQLKLLPAPLQQRMVYFKRLKEWLKTIPVAQKDIVLASLKAQLNDVEFPRLIMNWNDLASLRNSGHYIGSHTHTHQALNMITNKEQLKEELTLPRQLINTNLGYLPVSIAYPFGLYNKQVKEMAAEVGYQIGIASDRHEVYIKNRHNIFEIPRIAISNESWFMTKLRITNRIEQIKSVIPKRLYLLEKPQQGRRNAEL